MAQCSQEWHGSVWDNLVCHGMVWCALGGTPWCGKIWCGVAHGMAWNDKLNQYAGGPDIGWAAKMSCRQLERDAGREPKGKDLDT